MRTKKRRKLVFGKIIEYDPENNLKDEQERIIRDTLRQIRSMAAGNETLSEEVKQI